MIVDEKDLEKFLNQAFKHTTDMIYLETSAILLAMNLYAKAFCGSRYADLFDTADSTVKEYIQSVHREYKEKYEKDRRRCEMEQETRTNRIKRLEDALLEHVERCSKCIEGVAPSVVESAILATVPQTAMALIELWKFDEGV